MRSTGQGEEGNARAGFDFTRHMSRICADMVERLPPLAHVDMTRVAVSFCQTRKGVSHGMFASLTPLRFAGGEREVVRRAVAPGASRESPTREGAKCCTSSTSICRGFSIWSLPRRSRPRSTNCGTSGRSSTATCGASAAGAMLMAVRSGVTRPKSRSLPPNGAQGPPPTVYRFLEDDFRGLVRRHGTVFGTRVPIPKFVRLAGQ